MGSTLNATAIDKLLRDRYPEGDEVWAQFNTGAPGLDLITSGRGLPKYGKLDAEGRQLRIPVRTSGNPNAASPIPESIGYPTTGNQAYDEAVYTINQFVSSFQITGLARAKAPGGAKSVRNAFELEMTSQMENARQKMNRYFHSDGSGMLALIASYAETGPRKVNLAAGTDLTLFPVGIELEIKDLNDKTTFAANHPTGGLALVVVATGTTSGVPWITVRDENGAEVNTLGTGDTVANFGVYIRQAQGYGLHGLGVMCSDVNPTNWGAAASYYAGIDRAAKTWWKAYRLDAGGSVVSIQAHIQPILAQIDRQSGAKFGGRLFAFSGYDNFYAVANSLARNQRTNYMVRLKGGYEAAQYNQALFVIDFHALASEVRFLSPKTTYRYIMDEWYWEDDTGSLLERVSDTNSRPTNTFRLNMLTRQQLVSVQCITNAALYNTAAAT